MVAHLAHERTGTGSLVGDRSIPPAEVLAQRSSSLGSGGAIAAPAIRDAGSPLEPATRSAMESSFGRDFSKVRVHDDAGAHDDARALGSLAYAAGDHVVFGAGSYQPETPTGQALIAHELAHTVQQGGVQMKTDGPMPAGSDRELEGQADRAALDATAGRSVGRLGTVGRPAVFRTDVAPAAAPKGKGAKAAGVDPDLPGDVEVIEEIPEGRGATHLIVKVPLLKLPAEKGTGPWVQEGYSAMGTGERLAFSPIFGGKSFDNAESIKAFKEPAGEKYKDRWLNNYGFTTLKQMAESFAKAGKADPTIQAKLDAPGVAKILKGFTKNQLSTAGTDIDHVVEKQLGGSSVPGNLQVLMADKNRKAGRETYGALITEINRVLKPHRPDVRDFQIRFADALVVADKPDPSYELEMLLRDGKSLIRGSEDVMSRGIGTPVLLHAGGASETVRVRPNEAVPIDVSARALVHGMRLTEYRRTKGSSATTGVDTVVAELTAPVIKPAGKNVILTATLATGPLPPEPASGAAALEKAAASETRKLTLDKAKNKDVGFYYPYLSAGKVTSIELDDQQNVIGTGVITPSVKFLGNLNIVFGPNRLELAQDISVEALNKSPMVKPISSIFRFTKGQIGIDLVNFKPHGEVKFEIGRENAPIILGSIDTTTEGGAFVATGKLTPGRSIPGVTEASGTVKYHSETGWEGLLTATGSPFTGATMNAQLGFKSDKSGGGFKPFATGGIKANLKGGEVAMKIAWQGGRIAYYGGGTIPNPVPLVKAVYLKGSYEDGELRLEGTAPIEWKDIKSTITVRFHRKDGEEGRFSGDANLKAKFGKMDGAFDLHITESGKITGKGEISYWVTDKLQPKLGVEITKDERVRLFGAVKIPSVELLGKWPDKEEKKHEFLKVGASFDVPTPIPSITAFAEIYASAYLSYGVGPVALVDLVFDGELFPFEPDPKINAGLAGKLSLKGFATLGGELGVNIGVRVALGALGAKGGLAVVPHLTIRGEAFFAFTSRYSPDGFSAEGVAMARGELEGGIDLKLKVALSALWGLLTDSWEWKIGGFTTELKPAFEFTIGKVSYGKGDKAVVAPDPKPSTDDLDTQGFMKGLLAKAKDKDKKPIAPPIEVDMRDEMRYHGRMI